MAEATEQPGLEYQVILDSIMEATPDEVVFMGRKHKVGWLRNATIRLYNHIMLTESDQLRRNMKLCACILSNDVFVWFRRLVWAVRWRWYQYVRDPDTVEVLKVLDAGKKKIPSTASLLVTTLSTGMRDVMMAMTRTEAAKSTRAAQPGGQPTA